MFRLIRNKNGSGIIWAMAVAGFLLLILGAVLTISLTYHSRSLKNDDTRQVYLTARSGVNMIIKEFTKGSEASERIYDYLEINGTWTVDDAGFVEPMGSCSIELKLEPQEDSEKTEKTITIKATAEKNSKIKTIKATIIGVIERQGSSPEITPDPDKLKWYVSSYTDGGKEADND